MAEMLDYSTFHLVGIKGVAMTALAQCLVDAGKKVTGSDVKPDFVTKKVLAKLELDLQLDFDSALPAETECVIYTAAHGGITNPQVKAALAQQLPILSHAEALAELFNDKQGVAVCGVGGKSTISAMITWILEHAGAKPSFAVGVGNIPGLEKTGFWSAASQYFVAEADEYAMQPPTGAADWQLIPRFSFLKPFVTVCSNLKYDHPDVYQDFTQTQAVFKQFFLQLKNDGTLIINSDDEELVKKLLGDQRLAFKIMTFGLSTTADVSLVNYSAETGKTITQFLVQGQAHTLELQIPGRFNALNALGAISACLALGIPIETCITALAHFRSTMRRFEFMGEKAGVTYYDDYAHHPHEITQAIQALGDWFPTQRKVIAFQSHTFSRTKQLFSEFVAAFSGATEVVMIDIFPSARETFDPSVTSDSLCQAITNAYPAVTAQNLKTIPALQEFCRTQLKPGAVFLTLGAGDIYDVYQDL